MTKAGIQIFLVPAFYFSTLEMNQLNFMYGWDFSFSN